MPHKVAMYLVNEDDHPSLIGPFLGDWPAAPIVTMDEHGNAEVIQGSSQMDSHCLKLLAMCCLEAQQDWDEAQTVDVSDSEPTEEEVPNDGEPKIT